MKEYTKDSFETLKWNEHIRLRSGMYIGNLGDGSSPDDGIYVLIKEVIDNSIDEHTSGNGNIIDITIEEKKVSVRDYGRGIPLEVVIKAASVMNSGAKYNDDVFKKSVGLNGVGLKAVNATSSYFFIESYRDGKYSNATFNAGEILNSSEGNTTEKNGTLVSFIPDDTIFIKYNYDMEFIEEMIKNYSYLNTKLTLRYNGTDYKSENGLLDLVNDKLGIEPLYPPIHLIGTDIEIVLTHSNGNGENIASFVNGQNTTQGGTHLSAYREVVAKTIKDFLKKDFDPSDVRHSMVGAISVRVAEPVFGNQTKTILNSKEIEKGISLKSFIGEFVKDELDNYLHRNLPIADIILKKVQEAEKERKAINTIKKATRERTKKASLHNKKLRDCRIHYTDTKNRNEVENTTLFITEGDSASGSITKSRNPNTQAVFSLKGKPLNSYKKKNKDIYSNEELILLKAALNIDEDFENLRYNKIVIATDADVDGMHIRLLLLTFFLKFYPELIIQKHIFILQTPLFRVRNKKETHYCYSEEEKENAIKKLGANPEITRFKGLGEISPEEFKNFIGADMRLDTVQLDKNDDIPQLLEFYMGDNTPDRKDFICKNLKSELAFE